MRFNKLKILLFTFFILLLVNSGMAQDTIYVKGSILSIDTMKYYIVLKIRTFDSIQSTKIIFSKRDLKDDLTQNSQEVKVCNEYEFKLLGISIFKADDGKNIILNLRKYSYSNIFELDNGEFPYLALNMSGMKIFTNNKSH